MKTIKILIISIFYASFVVFTPTELMAQKKKSNTQTIEFNGQTFNSIEELERYKSMLKAKQGSRDLLVDEDPCTLYDSDKWYTAFNSKKGVMGDPNLATSLLSANQQQLRQKIKGRYQAVVRDYFEQMDVDGTSNAASHIQSAGDMVIDQFLNDTREYCRKTSESDDRGNIIMYMSIRVSKEEMVDRIATGISSGVPADKKAEVRFNESEFRKNAMNVFKEVDDE